METDMRGRNGSRTAMGAVALVATMTAGAVAAAPAHAEGRTEITGTLADSTAYRFVVPDDWNGTVFVELDFASSPELAPAVEHLLNDGAAYGGTTRAVTGWNIAGAIDNQIEALERFEQAYGPAQRRIATGTSMGGNVAAGTVQRHPGAIDGAAAFCGGLSGSVSQWNQKLDTVFVLAALLDPEGALPVLDVPADVAGAVSAWQTRLADAQASSEGRARIALAAAVGQLPAWSQGAPRPAARDAAAYQEGWYGALATDPLPYIGQAMSSRRNLQLQVGGNPSWNTGVDYSALFRSLDPQDRRVVERLYREAGLDLRADLATVDAAERITADEDAVRRFEAGIEFDGALPVPVLTMNNLGDQISTVAQQQEYERVARRAGDAAQLRQVYVESAGHCAFSDAEKVVATEALLDRLDRGRWGALAHPVLNRQARELDLGAARFVPFRPADFTRPFAPGDPVPSAGAR